jgi:Tfp pilus assembly protein PilX
MINLPVKFHEKAKQSPSANGTGYPHRISANDLDRNFAYAALDAGEGWIESASVGSHQGRKLKLPELPSSGTHVLGCIDGTVQWIETEGCEESPPA